MIILHPTRTCNKKIVTESIIYIGYFLFRAPNLLNNELQDITLFKPLTFIKEDMLSICRPARKVPEHRRAIKRRIGEDRALVLPVCIHDVDRFRVDPVWNLNEPLKSDLCAIGRPVWSRRKGIC